jgi:hypothetical protein
MPCQKQLNARAGRSSSTTIMGIGRSAKSADTPQPTDGPFARRAYPRKKTRKALR